MVESESSQQQELYIELYEACRNGKAERVKFYINAGLKTSWINRKDRNRSLLMATAWKDSEDVCKLLLEKEAPINHMDTSLMTALHICAKQNSPRVAKLLLECEDVNLNAKAESGITPLMICADLGHVDIGYMLIEHKAIDLNAQNSRGFTALMKAVFENSEDLAKRLIEKNARLDLASHSGFTALHLCAQLDRQLLAELMLKKAIENQYKDLIDRTTKPEYQSNTAFALAALNRHAKMVELLRKYGANIFHLNANGENALCQVTNMGSGAPKDLIDLMSPWFNETKEQSDKHSKTKPELIEELCDAILKEKTEVVKEKVKELAASTTKHKTAQDGMGRGRLESRCGQTPLMLAAAVANPEILALLLAADDTNVDHEADVKCGAVTALHIAIQSGSEACVKQLLDKGAQPSKQDAQNCNALHLAADLKSPESIVEMLTKKAKLDDFKTLNKDGFSPAEVAAVRGSVPALKLLLKANLEKGGKDNVERIVSLAEERNQFRAVNAAREFLSKSDNKTKEQLVSELFSAAMDRDKIRVEAILKSAKSVKSFIDGSCKQNPGWTALMATAWNDDKDTCEVLLKHGADPNKTDASLGITALHIAVQQNSKRVAEALLLYDADLNWPSRDKRTPLIRAAWLDHREIGQMLLKKTNCDVNKQELDAFSALHFCAQENLAEFALMLIHNDANLELKTDSKKGSNTAFTLAVIKGHVKMLELLANVGANIYHTSSRGDAMTLARKAQQDGVIQLLLQLDRERNNVWGAGDQTPPPTPSRAEVMCSDGPRIAEPHAGLPQYENSPNTLNSSTMLIRGPEYPMNSLPRGACVIINNDTFPDPKDFRAGSSNDVDRLVKLFTEKLKFRVQVHINLDAADILAVMQSVANSERHEKYKCFAAFIMSHGETGRVLGSDGVFFRIDDIYNMFRQSRGLIGKPKLFFVNACRQSASETNVDVARTSASSTNSQSEYPDKLDFLFSYATTEGDVAVRNTGAGSVYVQALCDVFSENYQKFHLCDMLVQVRSKIARIKHTLPLGNGGSVSVYNVSTETTHLSAEVWFKDAS